MRLTIRLICAALAGLPGLAIAQEAAPTTAPATVSIPQVLVGDNQALQELQEILKNAQAKSFIEKAAYIGVGVEPATAALVAQLKLPPGTGLLVTYVDPSGPAKSAGIEKNDVLIKMDEQVLVDLRQLQVLVRMDKPGERVKLSLLRQGQTLNVSVKLGENLAPPLYFESADDNLFEKSFTFSTHEPLDASRLAETMQQLIESGAASKTADMLKKVHGARDVAVTSDMLAEYAGQVGHARFDSKGGLTFTITRDNKPVAEYKADNLESLKAKDPEGYKRFREFFPDQTGNGNPANGGFFMVATVPQNAKLQLPAGVNQQEMNFDDGLALTLTRQPDGRLHLLAKDKSGVTAFDGIVSTLDQGDLPQAVREKLGHLQAPVISPELPTMPATQPASR